MVGRALEYGLALFLQGSLTVMTSRCIVSQLQGGEGKLQGQGRIICQTVFRT
jgi:hypothetical protein